MSQPAHHDDQIWEIVARAQGGEQSALGELFDRFYDGVYRYAYVRLGSVSDAEEAAQETFTQMVRSISRLRRRGPSFEAWLFRIARNVCADEQRRRYRRKEDSSRDLPHVAIPSAEDHVVLQDENERLHKMLGSLPEEQRRVLELRFAGGLSAEDVGRVLGKSAGAVRIQQMRALQNLRQVIEELR
ncbi:MAG: RNA polymerase sigma factor [Actinomycetota bacterium]